MEGYVSGHPGLLTLYSPSGLLKISTHFKQQDGLYYCTTDTFTINTHPHLQLAISPTSLAATHIKTALTMCPILASIALGRFKCFPKVKSGKSQIADQNAKIVIIFLQSSFFSSPFQVPSAQEVKSEKWLNAT
jgi:hypothetical protein